MNVFDKSLKCDAIFSFSDHTLAEALRLSAVGKIGLCG